MSNPVADLGHTIEAALLFLKEYRYNHEAVRSAIEDRGPPADHARACMCSSMILKHSPSILEPHPKGSEGCWWSVRKIKERLIEKLSQARDRAPPPVDLVYRQVLEVVDRAFEGA
ncbi:MAG: hypothetical protein IT371_30310 [Deltaproteobacteria bacterium]|nr:hypothetical protein [Deltaproteobacteria bacterium]